MILYDDIKTAVELSRGNCKNKNLNAGEALYRNDTGDRNNLIDVVPFEVEWCDPNVHTIIMLIMFKTHWGVHFGLHMYPTLSLFIKDHIIKNNFRRKAQFKSTPG